MRRNQTGQPQLPPQISALVALSLGLSACSHLPGDRDLETLIERQEQVIRALPSGPDPIGQLHAQRVELQRRGREVASMLKSEPGSLEAVVQRRGCRLETVNGVTEVTCTHAENVNWYGATDIMYDVMNALSFADVRVLRMSYSTASRTATVRFHRRPLPMPPAVEAPETRAWLDPATLSRLENRGVSAHLRDRARRNFHRLEERRDAVLLILDNEAIEQTLDRDLLVLDLALFRGPRVLDIVTNTAMRGNRLLVDEFDFSRIDESGDVVGSCRPLKGAAEEVRQRAKAMKRLQCTMDERPDGSISFAFSASR